MILDLMVIVNILLYHVRLNTYYNKCPEKFIQNIEVIFLDNK